MTIKNLYAFTLGREWKISLAELIAIFGNDAYQSHSETIAIFQIVGYSSEQLQRKFLTIGGSIRLIELLHESTPATFPTDVIDTIKNSKNTGKIDFALGCYGVEFRLSDIGLRIKKTLQESGASVRLVNLKNENINAASFKKEKLAKTRYEYSLIILGNTGYMGRTLACQDIDSYAKRDTAKSRDMIIGMMPPKLVQMMINIAVSDENIASIHHPVAIYDPFCGLGTTLIEAANMGIYRVYGSDLSSEMVRSTESSLDEYIREEKVWQERILKVGGTPNKDFSHFQSTIWQMDAREVVNAKKYLIQGGNSNEIRNIFIVSEGYLGEIMRPHEITLDRVKEERRKLERLYSDFFRGLSEARFAKSIVMTFPFWNLNGTYSYFAEIYDIIGANGFEVVSLLPWEMKLNTMKGSLLYRRENQTVGREIIKIIPRGSKD